MRTVRTERLVLEPQIAAHAEEMFEVLSDPAIYEFENEPPSSRSWLRERFRKLETRRSADGREHWLNWVIRVPSSELIGYVQATVYPDGRASIAYELASRFWGRGLGTAAVQAMIPALTEEYGVRTLSAVFKQRNHRSQRLLERLGFSPASPELHAKLGAEPDEVLMILERRDFCMTGLEAHYSARDIEARILAALRAAGLNPEQRLSPEALGALDHFHTGGLRASRELQALVHIRAEDRVLDVGAGLAGPARMLAFASGCRVDCLEMSPDFCAGAALLNRLTGLDDRIRVHEGSALDMPFPDDSFDVAWMQNVGMNIADKRKLYAEIYRVLKPGGRFAFQEMAAGKAAASYYPLPWATDPADNFLVSAEEMRSALAESGFVIELLEDTSDTHLSRTAANATPAAPGQLGLAVYVENLAQKAGNARRSLEEGQVRLVRGVFRAE